MHSVMMAAVFLVIVLVPGVLAVRLQDQKEHAESGFLAESEAGQTWAGVSRPPGGRPPLASKSPGRWAGRARKQWRTS